jgi:hypothetical protein
MTEIELLRKKAAVLEQILHNAVDGLREHRDSTDGFERGQAFAYSDTLDVAATEAEVLGLAVAELGMLDLNPDTEIIGRKKAASPRRRE